MIIIEKNYRQKDYRQKIIDKTNYRQKKLRYRQIKRW